jgi:hypothetical protein
MTAEEDILKTLSEGQLSLPPVQLRVIERNRVLTANGTKVEIDAVVQAEWDRRSWKFAAEVKRLSTPKILQDALRSVDYAAKRSRLNPMLVVPYLSPENIEMLERLQVSGIDLCGNGILIVPPELLIVRTGNPNRFPQSAPIRNVYRGDSSLVARAFLARPIYRAIGDIATAIRELSGNVSLATVSKVVKVLEGDLIVGREQGDIRLLQPEKLLDQLAANYRPPKAKGRYVGKVALGERELERKLADIARSQDRRFVLTGATSASNYAVLGREPVVAAYCDESPEQLLPALGGRVERTDRFPNLDLIWTDEATVYFDPQPRADVPFASPVQAYVELMAGDKRQRETAEQVREYVLRTLREKAGTTE